MDDAEQGVESGFEPFCHSLCRANAGHIAMTSYTNLLTRPIVVLLRSLSICCNILPLMVKIPASFPSPRFHYHGG